MTDEFTTIRNTTMEENPLKAAQELNALELRAVIQEGVYRGVLKAVAVYLLISLIVWFVVANI